MKPISPDKFAEIDQAAHSGAYGNNPIPLPTDKQKQAGNYKKGKFSWQGLNIAIEQPQNSYRTGLDDTGKRWSCRLAANYGYILGTKGNDKDHIDCFVGSYPQAERVYVVNQFVNGVFDEHKTMLCYPFIEFAISDYNHSYSRDWQGLHDIQDISIKQLKWWLKNGDMTKPLNKADLPAEDVTDMRRIFWDGVNPVDTDFTRLHYELSRIDSDDKLLTDSVSVADFFMDADKGSVAILDSLHTPYVALGRVCNKIMAAMKAAGSGLQDVNGNPLLPVESTPDAPNPSGLDTTFKRNGVVNLAAVFELTDGQSFTIVFHNPDSTPGKLNNSDTLIAWKFLLNKRDITIVVAPEHGEDLKLPKVAERVMNLAAKNSRAFARAESTKAENAQKINDLKTEIAGLEEEKKAAVSEYEAVKADYDDWLIAKSQQPKPPFAATHTVDDDGVQVPVRKNEAGIWEAENGNEYEGYDSEPIIQSVGKNAEFDPTTPENYAKVMADKGLQLKYQDVLDSFFSDRIVGIRNSLKELGWEGRNPNDARLYKGDNEIQPAFIHVGGGNNVVGVSFNEIPDDLTKTPEEFARLIDENSVQSTGQNSQGIDPATLANINAANISAALKKKAIAFFEKNPSAKSFEGSGLSKASQKAIMESIKTALFAEIKALSPLFKESDMGIVKMLYLDSDSENRIRISIDDAYKIVFSVVNDGNGKNLFDSTTTLDDLRAWGFALPFDLDVKAFVANVIKPVVDEFLSKQNDVDDKAVKTFSKIEFINLEWSEASDVENKKFTSFSELQRFIQEEYGNSESNIPQDGTYDKHKVNVRMTTDDGSDFINLAIGGGMGRIEVGATEYNPFTINLSEYLAQDYKDIKKSVEGGMFKVEIPIEPMPQPPAQSEIFSNKKVIATKDIELHYKFSKDDQYIYEFSESEVSKWQILVEEYPNGSRNINLKAFNRFGKPVKFDSRFLDDTEKVTPKLHAEIMRLWEQYDPNSPQNDLIKEHPENIANSDIDAEIESLRTETDNDRFNARLDDLAAKIEEVGLMDKYDAELNELADIAAQMAIENSKKLGG